MTLQLVTGPVNASKAGVVLGLVRHWAAAGRDPLLVVPTGPDAESYRRELLGDAPVVLGVRVMTFGGLEAVARERAGVPVAELGPVLRDRLIAAALGERTWGSRAGDGASGPRRRGARPLSGTGRRPGVRRRLLALLDELTERGAALEDLADALERLEPGGYGVDRALADDLRRIVGDYRRRAAAFAAGADAPADRAAVAYAVAAALAADPRVWGRRPVALYGFDDLTPGQERLVRAIARTGDVAVSLPFEDARPGTAARRELVDRLRALGRDGAERPVGDRAGPDALALPLGPGSSLVRGVAGARVAGPEVLLPAPTRHGGIGRLERRLFGAAEPLPDPSAEDHAASGDPAERSAAASQEQAAADVVLVTGGDARSEAEALVEEIVAAAAELGTPWESVAIGVRDAAGVPGSRLERELRARGVPVAREREVPVRSTATGRAVLALLRTASGRAGTGEVLDVLRAAATEVDAVDRLALTLGRERILDASEALQRAIAEQIAPDGCELLGEAEQHRAASRGALLDVLRDATTRIEVMLRPPHPSAGGDVERAAARVLRHHLRALAEVGAAAPDALPDPEELDDELGALPVPAGDPPGRGRIEIAPPAALRGRQLAVLALADLRERAFPSPEPVDPLVDRDARAVLDARDVLAAAGEVVLAVPPERVAAERLLFLELVARPTRRLLLSRPLTDGAGAQVPPAPFLVELEAALAPLRPTRRHRRAVEVRPPPRRAVAVAAPLGSRLDATGRETVRRAVLDHRCFTVSEVEQLVRCPVCWLVERFLGACDKEPEAEPLRQGNVVHEVLQQAVGAVARDARSYGVLDPDELERAGREAVAAQAARLSAGLPEHLAAVLRRRTEDGVVAVLRELPVCFDPARLFGVELTLEAGGDLPPLDLGEGTTAVGRIDRVDTVPLPGSGSKDAPGVGVVDYKLGARGVRAHTAWERTGTLQTALYLHAAATATGGAPAYGLYQRTTVSAAVGAVADKPAGVRLARVLGGRKGGNDPETPAEMEEVVERALATARDAVARLRDGAVDPDHSPHARDGDCRHPVIARLLG